ncbi:UDP-2,3-diacylglucosamine diphosphatase [Mucilaginibacter myungsuensis]|uniref:UDP-2,3-diacylglucosamine diphosphatase n=1 Tax=Mucilaginibacter myungsuensis TaxID=649104 RepID=A0A929PVT6_9SPHI|nr:UDP-2,3-diacylglucosamine diphosphatase [Mucilaginibacter myungsuensis]MBE9661459.1 UDP-2,3-diacylglucosamine diphosphatase [Mucilaginibacter myungsuensis]MDN3597602.1 UDP-2,3-diacylglucosamine diphosphatase [Mucilaginibacter myungsuensis]
MAKREVDIAIISDVHLGTYGCHAKELLKYLKSIKPKALILNGDIIDIWQFSKSYWPDTHMKVVRRIMKFVTEGTPVYYLTGNHDEMLRKFADFDLGAFKLMNKLVLDVDGKKAWIFHGDVFDVTMQHSKWLAKLGAVGYDTLILINSVANWFLTKMGRQKMSFSQKVKAKFKDAVKFINAFEQTAADLAVDKGYDYVICGHIHHAEIRNINSTENNGSVLYLNSGDWVESLTALEYHDGQWKIFQYRPEDFETEVEDDDKTDAENLDDKLNVNALLEKFRQETH